MSVTLLNPVSPSKTQQSQNLSLFLVDVDVFGGSSDPSAVDLLSDGFLTVRLETDRNVTDTQQLMMFSIL